MAASSPASSFNSPPVIGYHQIRGLGAPLRMMCAYKGQPIKNVAYGSDMRDTWFKGEKPKLQEKNGCINLPYVIDTDSGEVVTQSNTCALYLGKRLGIDADLYEAKNFSKFINNHLVLDQAMDLRNDLMKIVYPFAGQVPTKVDFPAKAKEFLTGTAITHLTKLENLLKQRLSSDEKGVFMSGETPYSGDFMLWEMLDQLTLMAAEVNNTTTEEKQVWLSKNNLNLLQKLFDKLKTGEAAVSGYLQSAPYKEWAANNGLYTFFTGQGEDFVYGKTMEVKG